MPIAAKNRLRMRRLTLSAIAILLTLVFVLQTPLAAQNATLSNIIITNTNTDLLVYLNVDGAFREQTVDAIMNGVPTSFSFFIKLFQKRAFWFDKVVADVEVTNSIKFNNLKKEFVVERSWENNVPRTVQSLDAAKKLMSDLDGLKLVPLSSLKKGNQYQLRAKAQLSKVILPFYLHYVLFFVSLWDFETDWYTIDFIY